MRRLSVVSAALLLCGIASAESRFGRPVMKVANPKEFGYFKLDDNQFPFLEKGALSVSCMTYRGTRRFVPIGNAGQIAVTRRESFIQRHVLRPDC
jgi:hypothetical protein